MRVPVIMIVMVVVSVLVVVMAVGMIVMMVVVMAVSWQPLVKHPRSHSHDRQSRNYA